MSYSWEDYLFKICFYFYIPRCFPQEAVGSSTLTSVCTTEWEREKVRARSLRNRPGEQSAWHLSPSLRLMLCLSPSMSRTTHPSPRETGGVRACDSFKSPQPGRRTSTLHVRARLRPSLPLPVSPARDTVINHGEAPGRQGDRKITLYRKAAETGGPTNSSWKWHVYWLRIRISWPEPDIWRKQ